VRTAAARHSSDGLRLKRRPPVTLTDSTTECFVSRVLLFIPDVFQEQVVKAILVAHGIAAQSWRPKGDSSALHALPANTQLIADMAAVVGLGSAGMGLGGPAINPDLQLILLASRVTPLHTLHRRYGAELGARMTLPAFTLRPDTPALARYGERLVNALGLEFDARRTRQFISGLRGTLSANEAVDLAYKRMEWFAAERIDWQALLNWLITDDPLQHADRSWRITRYKHCFVARHGVDRLAEFLTVDRARALRVGQLLNGLGLFRHVAGSASFDDADLYFRLIWPTKRLGQLRFAPLLARLSDDSSGPFAPRAGKRGAATGAAVVEALQRNCDVPTQEAQTIGQTLLDVGALRGADGEPHFVERDQYQRMSAVESETSAA
jgi:hypothetical protein